MPIVDANDPSVWDAQYLVPWFVDGGPGVGWTVGGTIGYTRAAFFESRRRYAELLIAALTLTTGHKIAVIGAGYGWTCEWLQTLVPGITAINADVSSYIQGTKARTSRSYMQARGVPASEMAKFSRLDEPEATLPVLIIDVTTGQGRAQLRQQNCTHIVSENILPWLTDSEITALDNAMHNVEQTIVVGHLVVPIIPDAPPEPPPLWNWKSMADYRALLPNSVMISTDPGRDP